MELSHWSNVTAIQPVLVKGYFYREEITKFFSVCRLTCFWKTELLIGSHSTVIRRSRPFSNYIIFGLCVSNLWMQLLTWCKLVDTRWQLGIHCHLLCYVLSIHHISICLHFWIGVQEERLPELGPHGKHPAWDIPLQFVRQIQAGNWLKMFSWAHAPFDWSKWSLMKSIDRRGSNRMVTTTFAEGSLQ